VLAVVIGHDYPFYLGFKGGKGVATSLGAVSAIDFRVAMVCLLFALIIMAISNMVSLGSMSGFVIAPFMYMYFNHDYEMSMVITIVALTALCLYRHKENIKRIVKGEENKIRK
ncbi:MAG: acyl-phosphate glycerol-3-phosphate acyltransferase, partial [Tissierellia bacterium]|nr:acyl-phosphate glycerol-3-phosphate acyltransferase [Tissierellia bacterium]